ncbi:NAD(P)H-hydrate epimerase [Schumannella sp. 10F1B-5-1]|uniref:NAD(P)H-hydrate epimerase n=1 Tax=Schumannella sp. 10F1B-5-1 TaxID=2590780 RepID=UPI00112FD579|nr:NAD(P)H-hydrate epimerase [Schumannella sp. 10F1B-5-1]TPW73770.1 NAD(P)H-hydrate epimerase [Schumannella sp. 10F1B-5-1]
MTTVADIRDGWSAEQIRAAERPLLDAGEPLMRRAAAALAAVVREQLSEPGGRVVLLAGSGNNGGDGLFAAAELARDGVAVTIVPTGSRLHDAGLTAAVEAGAEFDRAAAAHPRDWVDSVGPDALLLDAMLGIGAPAAGLRGAAHDVASALLPRVTERDAQRLRVVAVDVPSGIGVDDGAAPDDGVLLPATITVTFGAMKAGLLRQPGASLAGEVRLIDLGLAPHLRGSPLVRVS